MLRCPKAGYRTAAAGLLAAALSIAGCAGLRDGVNESEGAAVAHEPHVQASVAASSTTTRPSARVIAVSAPLECVPYARRITGVSIRGNAWTWWRSAGGRYRRNGKPALGSILVLKRTSRLHYGHLAVVSRVLNSREILADHAN